MHKIRPLQVEADLDLEIDGRPARISGSGKQLRLELPRPDSLDAVIDSAAPFLKRAANTLSLVGLTLSIVDGRKDLLLVGHGVSSRLSSRFLGSPHVAPASLTGWLKLIRLYWKFRHRFQ